MKNVAVLQSNYIPWRGYFDIINDVDLFIFYDDVQYTKNDWRNRNRIPTPAGVKWLTIPVGSSNDRLICEVTIDDPRWQKKHWKQLSQNYAKAPFFKDYRAFLEDVYLERTWTSLSDMNQHMIRTIATEFLGIDVTFADSRDHPVDGAKQERLLNLLGDVGAERYVSGPAAKSYTSEAVFEDAGIDLVWKDYGGYPDYEQIAEPFDPAVSILDLLFMVGPDAPDYIWGKYRTPPG